MKKVALGAAVAAGVMLCGWMGTADRAEAATVVYTGYANLTDPYRLFGGSNKRIEFTAEFNENYYGYPVNSPVITGYISFGNVPAGLYSSDIAQVFYPVSANGRDDYAMNYTTPLGQPSGIGNTVFGSSSLLDVGFKLDSGTVPSDPEKPFFAYLKKDEGFGSFAPELIIPMDFDNYIDAGVYATLNPLTVSVNGEVAPVPLPATAPMFGAALLALGGIAHAHRQISRYQAARANA